VWDGCYERDIEELEKIQLEAARIVTGRTKFASKDSLYFETGWETLANRRKNRKLTIFYKIDNKLCPPYLINCLPPVASDVSNYNLRNNQNYVPPRCRLRTSACSFIPSTVSLWNNLDISIRYSPTISLFKNRVKGDIYKPPEYYNEGSRKLNILHTRLRHQCSSLNADLSRIHVINNYKCSCGASFEDAIHYFLECPLYLNERTLINIEILLFGNDDYSYDVNSKKKIGKVRTFINQSKRF
jgi:hypothetical protein